MGYYVRIEDSNAKIKRENLAEAYMRLCNLNKRDDLKRGGSWSEDKQQKKWFSWMDENYPETCKDAEAILEALGFDVSIENDAVHIVGYDNKTGQEELFMKTIGDLVEGEIEWSGEDGARWKWVFDQGMITLSGKVVYAYD